ncbi:helix-turn-helix transcriptional regulator [Oscillibacter hominis]|uniref:Helix-turn-helix transcriptional regulator n=1 Tax=Oscillibacter hominis TaxID=2763056 RepID=A0A7G9B7V8_9FIRM|nr:helix-turn-helix transcriptional regulator [Oscillibacter hominis]QNL45639.1 helix-turn-helix transcriptional regulator [Oscillibacter hominis]
MEFSEKLALQRKRRGLSQEQLADRLGVTRQSVSKWESGTAVPELGKLIALSELFSVSVDYLVKNAQDEEWPHREEDTGDAAAQARMERQVAELHRMFRGYRYTSAAKVFGLPLVSIRLCRRMMGRDDVARGVIAIGNAAVGVVAIGAFSVGLFGLGAFSVGLAAVGALAAGGVSFGALSVGVVAMGSCAIGVWTCGVASVAKEVAVGIAAAAETAVGKDAVGTHVLLWGDGLTKAQVEEFLLRHHPGLWKPLLHLLSFFGANIQ